MAVLLAVAINLLISANSKKKAGISPINVFMIGVFAAITLMFIPIHAESFAFDNILVRCFKTFIISMHHAIRLFIVDCDFEVIKKSVAYNEGLFYNIYTCYAAVLFVTAPALSFGVVLSFFKNASAYRSYFKSYNNDIYIFSKLNGKSLALAESVLEKYKHVRIIFVGVQDEDEDEDINLAKAKKLKAICFKDDILSVNFNFHSRDKQLYFFMIDDDESENLKLALSVIEKYKERKNTWMYVLSNGLEGEVLLSSIDTKELKVRRISDVRILVYSMFETKGELIFREAVEMPEYNKKLISALVVGLGKKGTEMTKSLVWFGQMDGYRLEITAFDKAPDAKARFSSICPELMDDRYNNNFSDDGESQYKLDIRDGVDAETIEFLNDVQQIPEITYVFVDLGNDEKNIRTAIKLRTLLLKKGKAPRIQAVVSNTDRKNALEGITNHSGQSYDIDFVGDVESLYSVGCIIDSELEAEALSRHLKWGKEEDFWRYEYNHRSSVASALHRRMKVICNIPGVDKIPQERTETERLNLRMMEHRRWNAYMRSEGFTYAEKRNNLAKTHNCLVTYDILTPEEKAKDDD